MHNKTRHWVPEDSRSYITGLEDNFSKLSLDELEDSLLDLVDKNNVIHNQDCINLNPATNTMNPKAEALLASGLGSRPSLGFPGDKYEMGLEAIEKIEVICNQLVADVFQADYVETRLSSGALANLYAFMATCKAGDTIIVPPPEIGGHVTHHQAGAAGLYGLDIHYAPISKEDYTVDVEALAEQAKKLKPKLITIGGSLNFWHHPVKEIVATAKEIGAIVHFDAAHLSGIIAGQAWPNPLEEGADIMTFSTYKSLGGPPAGVLITNNAEIAERVDAIAFPGLTANFDVAKTAALAMTMLDWKHCGTAYGQAMVDAARTLAKALADKGLPVYSSTSSTDFTASHQVAIEATQYGGGQVMAKRLRRANILASGIGLPIAEVEGDMNGLRVGTNEIVRWGMKVEDMSQVAEFVARALSNEETPEAIAPEVSNFRKTFQTLHFIRQ